MCSLLNYELILQSINPINVILLAITSGIALLYFFWDVNYFLRVIVTIIYGKLFLPKRKPSETTTLYGFCTTQDVDVFLRHMNNARYIRELDFARFQFYERTGLYKAIVNAKGNALQGASSIRYRRTIPIFTWYKIVTKLIYWDDKSLYLEQQFITTSDNFVRAVVLSKQNIVGVDVNKMLNELLDKDDTKPEISSELKFWLESIEASSSKLRKSD